MREQRASTENYDKNSFLFNVHLQGGIEVEII